MNPKDYGVPHDSWRNNQEETINWINNSRYRTTIVQAPTGSGKSAVAAALGKFGTVRTLTHTINLQNQYEEHYDFEPLYGMNNYECELLKSPYNCDSCLYSDSMYNCPVSKWCTYIIRRDVVKDSRRQSLSYAYFVNAVWVKEHQTNFLYCDEGHLLPGIVKDYCTVSFTPIELQHYNLPMYPKISVSSSALRVSMSIGWLEKVLVSMKTQYNDLVLAKKRAKNKVKIAVKMRLLTDKINRLSRTIWAASIRPQDFYCQWDDREFRLVPLTARLYFPDMFLNNWTHKTVITSATIGNPKTLATELGIRRYDFRDVPSNFSPKQMPIFTFSDAPKLGSRTTIKDWQHWSDIIGRTILDLDSNWSGILHVSSKAQALSLAERLSKTDLQDRIYIADGKGTGDKINRWQKQLKKVPNTLAISYSFHMGLDAPDAEINIVAKIPFKTLDSFGMAELEYNPDLYRWDAAILTEQACGRIRRGENEHYENDGDPMRKFVGIADGNYKMLLGEFSDHFKQCITEY